MLLNLIKHQRPDIHKVYLYVKDLFKSKYQLLINEKEKVGTEILKNPKGIIDIRKNISACLFSVHNTISLSCHEQVCLMRLRFERYFSHHGDK